jgi:hypothetical protein
MKKDLIVEEARRVREELVKKHGGLDGWIDHLQELDKARGRKTKTRELELPPVSKGRDRPQRSRKKSAGSLKG